MDSKPNILPIVVKNDHLIFCRKKYLAIYHGTL